MNLDPPCCVSVVAAQRRFPPMWLIWVVRTKETKRREKKKTWGLILSLLSGVSGMAQVQAEGVLNLSGSGGGGRGEALTGLPQAPLCSSNGLLRRHGGVRNIISSYSPHEIPPPSPFSGVAFQIPQWLHLFRPKNQSPISEIKGDYTAH